MYLLFPSWCFNNISILLSTFKPSIHTSVFCIFMCLTPGLPVGFVIYVGMSLVNIEGRSPKAYSLWIETDLQWSKKQLGWVLSTAHTGAAVTEGLIKARVGGSDLLKKDCTNTGVTQLFPIYPWRWVVKAHTNPECDDRHQSWGEVCLLDVSNSQTELRERRSEVPL